MFKLMLILNILCIDISTAKDIIKYYQCVKGQNNYTRNLNFIKPMNRNLTIKANHFSQVFFKSDKKLKSKEPYKIYQFRDSKLSEKIYFDKGMPSKTINYYNKTSRECHYKYVDSEEKIIVSCGDDTIIHFYTNKTYMSTFYYQKDILQTIAINKDGLIKTILPDGSIWQVDQNDTDICSEDYNGKEIPSLP